MVGTDAASEGLNLQRLGTLINVDLPWNPTRLEQRKGRIQRIGQPRAVVFLANLRYRGSVEDRVHQLLSDRFRAIHDMFGQLPRHWKMYGSRSPCTRKRRLGTSSMPYPGSIPSRFATIRSRPFRGRLVQPCWSERASWSCCVRAGSEERVEQATR
ncbi:C-terminal helicase domain-containing protein [Thermomicrobium sp. 4228-Ro]|uniref:helicase-related protein n=1 Tax=Thermomicrobium sp. 4228-Ro TaxID=2993937 RepID=UPI002249334B|nr:C-terminal helicase domain-containing protein [Thermomicrobium sp. 4228-Ro]MCX2728285.1 C-terminal helicase domain-containing protein [Thermomicrobium sp. 4228-Ro]